jgi:DNA polymerase-1
LRQKSLPKQQTISYDGQQALFDFITPIDDTVKKKEYSLKVNIVLLLTKQKFEKLLSDIKKAEYFHSTLKPHQKKPVRAEPVGFSLSWKEGESVYIPIKHNISIDFNMNDVIEFLRKIFYDNNIKIIGQNIKYEYIILKNLGITPVNFYFDTMLAAYVLDPDNSPFNMDSLADRLLGYTTIKYSDIVPKKATLLDVEFSKVIDYACEDSDITLRLYNVLKPKIDNSKMKELFYNIEMPLICVIGNMELAGVSIDVKILF